MNVSKKLIDIYNNNVIKNMLFIKNQFDTNFCSLIMYL